MSQPSGHFVRLPSQSQAFPWCQSEPRWTEQGKEEWTGKLLMWKKQVGWLWVYTNAAEPTSINSWSPLGRSDNWIAWTHVRAMRHLFQQVPARYVVCYGLLNWLMPSLAWVILHRITYSHVQWEIAEHGGVDCLLWFYKCAFHCEGVGLCLCKACLILDCMTDWLANQTTNYSTVLEQPIF